MRTLFNSVCDFIRDDFHALVYGYTAIFLAAGVYLSYRYNLHEVWSTNFGRPVNVAYYFAAYAAAYYGIAVPNALILKRQAVLRRGEFWLRSLFFLSLTALGSTCLYFDALADVFADKSELRYVALILLGLQTTVIYLVPLLCLWRIVDRSLPSFYGLTFRGVRVGPCLLMVLLLVPLVVAASFHIDFRLTYPVFKPWMKVAVFGLGRLQMSAIYELVYGWQFVMLELMFRGALVFGMAALLGRGALLPMVGVYVVLHFGAPVAETIGAVFAGYFLGVLALVTRSIVGGAIIHIGVAYTMELAAYVQHFGRSKM